MDDLKDNHKDQESKKLDEDRQMDNQTSKEFYNYQGNDVSEEVIKKVEKVNIAADNMNMFSDNESPVMSTGVVSNTPEEQNSPRALTEPDNEERLYQN